MKSLEIDSSAILKPEYATNLDIQRLHKWAHLTPIVADEAIAKIWQNGRH